MTYSYYNFCKLVNGELRYTTISSSVVNMKGHCLLFHKGVLCYPTTFLPICITSTILPQDGFTALHAASQNDHNQVVRILIAAKASLNLQTNVSVMFSNICKKRNSCENNWLFSFLKKIINATNGNWHIYLLLVRAMSSVFSHVNGDPGYVYIHILHRLSSG